MKKQIPQNRTKKAPAYRGRQKDPKKAEAIISAARKLFMEHGFENVSVEAIAAEAEISKVTVYSHFKGKEELFERVLVTMCDEYPLVELQEIDEETDFRQALELHGIRLISIISSREVQDFHQSLNLKSNQFKSIMKMVYHGGPERTWKDLELLLKEGKKYGLHSAPDCKRAADQLLSMWKGMEFVKQEMGVSKGRSKKKMLDDIRGAIDLFMRAWPPQ